MTTTTTNDVQQQYKGVCVCVFVRGDEAQRISRLRSVVRFFSLFFPSRSSSSYKSCLCGPSTLAAYFTGGDILLLLFTAHVESSVAAAAAADVSSGGDKVE